MIRVSTPANDPSFHATGKMKEDLSLGEPCVCGSDAFEEFLNLDVDVPVIWPFDDPEWVLERLMTFGVFHAPPSLLS